MEKERIALCAMNTIFGFEPRLGLSLIRYADSARAIFDMDSDSLRAILGHFAKYQNQINMEALEKAERELENIMEDGCEFISINDPEYPGLLRECEDPPIGIYLKSEDKACNIFGEKPAIGIVGTRDMSPYGKEWCTRLVEAMANAKVKPVIVSGLAFGVDVTAHTAAMDNGLSTIAVMATGIDDVYPFRHIHVADRIVGAPGSCLLTDYPTGTSPLAIHFLRRNRIIAGLSSSVILIESKVKGGGMMTARLANSYNRDVYALPGRIDDIRSQGCNLLIREKIAEPVAEPEELVLRLGLGETSPRQKKDTYTIIRELYGDLGTAQFDDMMAVAKAIRKERGIDIEGIRQATGLQHGTVISIVEIMEADGIISLDLLGHCSFN